MYLLNENYWMKSSKDFVCKACQCLTPKAFLVDGDDNSDSGGGGNHPSDNSSLRA
jgi:hypothetical protein